jgi:small conductance mechanosensitive channel
MSVFFRLPRNIFFFLLVTTLVLHKSGFSQQADQQKTSSVSASSDVELLIGISQVIEQDKVTLQRLKDDSIRLEPLFQENTAQLNRLDTQLDSTQTRDTTAEQLAILQVEWKSSKRLLDLMLEYRRSIHQRIKILEQKINKMQEAADFAAKGELASILEITEQNELQEEADNAPSDPVSTPDTSAINQTDLGEYNWRVVEANRELEILKARFEYTKKGWLLVAQLRDLNQDHLTVTRSLVEGAQHELAQWGETSQSLTAKLDTLQKADSAAQLQVVIQDKIDETARFTSFIEGSLATDSTQINNLVGRVDRLTVLQDNISEMIADLAKQIEKQSRWLEYIKSPLAPYNIYNFVINRGPRILLIVLLLFLVWAGARWLTSQILKRVIRFRTIEQREERVETLNRAIRSALTVIILIFGGIALLSEFGINVSVLLGGAAVFSLAIAFGAQSLVKDYFSGFMILTENQYRVGNVVKINQISGVVEDITLRTTILRDLEGIAHFIPHGEITIVSNLTHVWSRVVLDIGIAYKENVDRVMEVIMEVAQAMREEPEYKHLITDEPEMLGVDAFADSAVIIKVLVKTRPMRQWVVKRELLRRLKNRFDELDIEIPFPHRTIYHHNLPMPSTEEEMMGLKQDGEQIEK